MLKSSRWLAFSPSVLPGTRGSGLGWRWLVQPWTEKPLLGGAQGALMYRGALQDRALLVAMRDWANLELRKNQQWTILKFLELIEFNLIFCNYLKGCFLLLLADPRYLPLQAVSAKLSGPGKLSRRHLLIGQSLARQSFLTWTRPARWLGEPDPEPATTVWLLSTSRLPLHQQTALLPERRRRSQ